MSTAWLSDTVKVAHNLDHLIEIFALDDTDALAMLRYSRRGFTSPPSDIESDKLDVVDANSHFEKRVIEAPVIAQSSWATGQIGGASFQQPATLKLSNVDGGLDQYRPELGYKIRGKQINYYVVDNTAPSTTLVRLYRGVITDTNFGIDSVTITFTGREAAFSKPTSSRVYRGTGPWMLELVAGSSSARIDCGLPAALDQTGSMCAELWVWWENLGTAATTTLLYGPNAGTAIPWRIITSDTGALSFQASVGGSISAVAMTGFTMVAGRWYHIAASMSGTTLTFVCFDDTAQVEYTHTVTSAYSSATRDGYGGGTTSFQVRCQSGRTAWVDEVRLWNTARSLLQIRANRYQPIDASDLPTGLVHHLGLNDGGGTTVDDDSVSNANGTITLAGTGTYTWLRNPEGSSELAGVPKPDLYGRVFSLKPVIVDPVIQLYQIAGGGRINGSLLRVSEGGVTIGTPAYTNAASMRALLTGAVTSVLMYREAGLFRLQSDPTYPVRCTATGYDDGTLGESDKPHSLLTTLVEKTTTYTAADLDTTTMTTLEDEYYYQCGVYLPTPKPIGEVVDRVMASVGGWWGWVDSDLLSFPVFTGDTSLGKSGTFTERDIINIEPVPSSPVHLYELVVRYRQSISPLAENEVAAAIIAASQRLQWTNEWKEYKLDDVDVFETYPPPSTNQMVIDTLLYNKGNIFTPSDVISAPRNALGASQLGDRWFAIFRNLPTIYNVRMRTSAAAVSLGQVIGLTYTNQAKMPRLGLDGTAGWIVLDKQMALQRGEVMLTVIGWTEV